MGKFKIGLVVLVVAIAIFSIVYSRSTPASECMTDTECGCTDDCLDPA